ncbi:MAG: J domain-containing protein [Candidatus Melainabacteria bacterium]|nr:J domain-containing protein [Candidatus Melainabacteria bacterium]
MPTREELQEAYAAFRLPVGSDWRAIKKRYKLLVKAWHPDKQGGQVKEEVEQELKEYNNYYNDVFKKHFESEHSDDQNCICQPVLDVHNESAQENFQEPENQSQYSAEPAEQVDPEIEARSLLRRWHASVCCAVVFVAILAYGYVGSKIRSMLPTLKSETGNSVQVTPASTAPRTEEPAWRAPYQSVSTPITPTSTEVVPPVPPVYQTKIDDTRRAIVANESKMQLLQQDVDTLNAQIKMADQKSAGSLYQELGRKEEQLRLLQQATYNLKHSIGEN